MSLKNVFANLATDLGQADEKQLLEAAVMLLCSIVEKMPRVDAADRLIVNPSESTSPVTVSSGTVTTVGTVSTMSNQTNIGGRDASHAAVALANIGTSHIYNNIQVSA